MAKEPDTAKEREHLEQVEEELAATDRHIAHERRFIAQAEREGHSTGPAEKTLHALRRFRHAVVHHQRILMERLRLYRR